MDPITQQTVLAAAGAAGGDPLYVDDVFSTYLYTGNLTSRSIVNEIDLSGEGGLVWIKSRESVDSHYIFDTERGAGKRISSDNNYSENNNLGSLPAFNSNGFSLGTVADTNTNNDDFVSWTFRKAPGFFDVVTYTGTGSARTVAHSLGSVPGMILVKRTDTTENWHVYHRSTGATKYLILDATNAEATGSSVWNDTTPTSTNFTVGTNGAVNGSGGTYVAYIFAHDDAQFGTDGDQSIIKCGSYTGTAATGNFVNLGFEPQWVMVKSYTPGNAQPWFMFDNMRGTPSGGNDAYLLADSSSDEAEFEIITFNPTGFSIEATGDGTNGSGQSYIYMAIRRPNKPPESATEVFTVDSQQINNLTPFYKTSGHISDFVLSRKVQTIMDWQANSRLTGTQTLITNSSSTESSNSYYVWDYMDGMNSFSTSGDDGYFHWSFKRAPGFMDVVAYNGTGSSQAVNHNLEVTPEFVIIKQRNSGAWDWICWHKDLTSTNPYIFLNGNAAEGPYGAQWIAPSSTALNLSSSNYHNASSAIYIAYLFATLPGISKVGSYSGSSSAVDVDCGFTNGARFVMIKRTDSTGDWYVFDTTRGIVSGNDPFLKLNSSEDQNSSQDYIDPLNAGFTANTGNNDINANGGTYLFLAIA